MKLYGFIKLGGENLTFALPIFKSDDNDFYIQVLDRNGNISNFIQQEGLSDKPKHLISLNENWQLTRNIYEEQEIGRNHEIGDKGTYIFVDHNGAAIVNSAEELEDCYRQVMFSTFELMRFLGKWKESEIVEQVLFKDIINDEDLKMILFWFAEQKTDNNPKAVIEIILNEFERIMQSKSDFKRVSSSLYTKVSIISAQDYSENINKKVLTRRYHNDRFPVGRHVATISIASNKGNIDDASVNRYFKNKCWHSLQSSNYSFCKG